MLRTRVYSIVVLSVLVCGCGRTSPTEPTRDATTLTGTWNGDVTESYGGRGRLRLVIEQVQFALSGRFDLEFEERARSRSGSLSGNVESPPLTPRMLLSGSDGFDCAAGQSPQSFLQVTWTRVGNTLRGEYVGFGCVGTIAGSFQVRRE